MSDNRTAEEFQSDPNVREWLQTVDEQLYMAASTAKNLALSPSGTKGKMLIARVLEEYASQQTASLREENKKLQNENNHYSERVKRLTEASSDYIKNVKQLQEEVERLHKLIASDSVYWALRNAVKSPSTLGDVEDNSYRDLYNLSVELIKALSSKESKPS